MPDEIKFEIQGAEELLAKIKSVNNDLRYKGGRFALRKAANLVRDAAKANAEKLDDPATAEHIAENVAVRWSGRQFKATGDLAFRVGILGGARQTKDQGSGKQNPGGVTFHWRFLEHGTEKQRARPFMLPALTNNIDAATTEFAKSYNKAIDRALTRAAKK